MSECTLLPWYGCATCSDENSGSQRGEAGSSPRQWREVEPVDCDLLTPPPPPSPSCIPLALPLVRRGMLQVTTGRDEGGKRPCAECKVRKVKCVWDEAVAEAGGRARCRVCTRRGAACTPASSSSAWTQTTQTSAADAQLDDSETSRRKRLYGTVLRSLRSVHLPSFKSAPR